MERTMEDRAQKLAVYMIETGGTVRSAARQFGISKSTGHKDLQPRLPKCDPVLDRKVRAVLDVNKAQRHLRGGAATREKYRKK